MTQSRQFLAPLLTRVSNFLNFVSPLTIIGRFAKRVRQSHLAVEIYVVVWFFMLMLIAWLVWAFDPLPLVPLIVVTAILVWRQLDILQAWFSTFLKVRINALSPVRSLVLATINYLELAVVFGVLTFLYRFGNFNPGVVSITESLRHSIGVITTIGSRFDPASLVGGLLYYSEIVFGLAFLIVIIARVLSLFKA